MANVTPVRVRRRTNLAHDESGLKKLTMQFDQGKQSQGEEEINELVKFGVRGNSHRLI